jgi:hypothetical protein
MPARAQQLLQLSSWLTGFSAFELSGTGMLDAYLEMLDASLPQNLFDELLACHGDDEIMDDPKLGPLARNIIVMWYSGTWTTLPDAWSSSYDAKDKGPSGVISGAAYQASLQWVAAGAHPAGAQQQGFGAWGLRPARPAQ